MEANPETVSPGYLQAVRALGINRLSYGVQSGVDRELRALGRRHTFARAAEAVKEAREAGFKNLSLDLMLGIPYQTADSLRETLEKILALHPDHLSCYLLKIEPGTPFARRHAETDCPSDDEAADFYLTVCETLRAAGPSPITKSPTSPGRAMRAAITANTGGTPPTSASARRPIPASAESGFITPPTSPSISKKGERSRQLKMTGAAAGIPSG